MKENEHMRNFESMKADLGQTVFWDFEHYASKNKASSCGYIDASMHMSRSNISKKRTRADLLNKIKRNDIPLQEKRDKLFIEYQNKIKNGEIRQATKIEILIQNSMGMPENRSTQAAKRLLVKMGVI